MRQLVLSSMPDSRGRVSLDGREFRYLTQVLRIVPGNTLDVRLPDGSLVPMTVLPFSSRDKSLTLSSVSFDHGDMEPVPGGNVKALQEIDDSFPDIVLLQWILKGPKMDQVIRQATETGVSLIVPVAGERCLSRDAESVGDTKTGRWERIIKEALQQSGSPVSTAIHAPVALQDIPEVLEQYRCSRRMLSLVLSEAPLARKSLHEYLVDAPQVTALAVGPEGGMSAAEAVFLEQTGFFCVHFRTNVLRAETAALYSIAAVQTALLESEKWRVNA